MAEDKTQLDISEHAAVVMRERGIDPAWVRRVVANPARAEPDKLDPAAMHALGRLPEFGDRVLRVIYNPSVSPWRVITAYFDRRMKGQL
jgi:hypothetical protein